jgi:membrane fusion protein (multidrug efflux system)
MISQVFAFRTAPALFLALCLWSSPRPVAAADSEVPGDSWEVRGLLVPSKQARLASRAKGVIEKIAREGQRVREGEVVMELESEMERLQLAQQEHILDLRTFEWQASTELNEKSVISQVEVQEKRVNFEIARVQLEQARHLLDRRRVVAPFAGAVAERLREEGEAVDEFTPVLLLVDLSTLHLELFLPGHRMPEIALGDAVEILVENGGSTTRGVVTQISPTVNPASGEFKVRVAVPNPEGLLTAGTHARARFAPAHEPSPAVGDNAPVLSRREGEPGSP